MMQIANLTGWLQKVRRDESMENASSSMRRILTTQAMLELMDEQETQRKTEPTPPPPHALCKDGSGLTRIPEENEPENTGLNLEGKDGIETDEKKFGKRFMKKVGIVAPHVSLLVLMVCYMLLGGSIFHRIETPDEQRRKCESIAQLQAMQQQVFNHMRLLLRKNASLSKSEWTNEVTQQLNQLTVSIERATVENRLSYAEFHRNRSESSWEFVSGVLFAATLMTTIGYGDLVPATTAGRTVCIFYGLVGVPLTLITIADLGKFVSTFILFLYSRTRKLLQRLIRRRRKYERVPTKPQERNSSLQDRQEQLMKLLQMQDETVPPTFVMLLLFCYMSIGAAAFSKWEGWTFSDALYYCFCTVTTIGFGDLVASNKNYTVITLCYVITGLVVTTMCIDLVGSHYLNKIHYFGRKVGEAQLVNMFLRRRLNLTEEQIQQMHNLLLNLKLDALINGRPFIPKNVKYMPYIDLNTEDNSAFYSQSHSSALVETNNLGHVPVLDADDTETTPSYCNSRRVSFQDESYTQSQQTNNVQFIIF